jgi:hypothetical protein
MDANSYNIQVTLTPSRQRIDHSPPCPFLEEDFGTLSSGSSFQSDSDVSSPSASSEGDGNMSGAEVRQANGVLVLYALTLHAPDG